MLIENKLIDSIKNIGCEIETGLFLYILIYYYIIYIILNYIYLNSMKLINTLYYIFLYVSRSPFVEIETASCISFHVQFYMRQQFCSSKINLKYFSLLIVNRSDLCEHKNKK